MADISDVMPRTYDVAAMEVADKLRHMAPDGLTIEAVARVASDVARRYRFGQRSPQAFWLGMGAMREAVALWEQAVANPPHEPDDHITSTGL